MINTTYKNIKGKSTSKFHEQLFKRRGPISYGGKSQNYYDLKTIDITKRTSFARLLTKIKNSKNNLDRYEDKQLIKSITSFSKRKRKYKLNKTEL
jgi:hypothetical protein